MSNSFLRAAQELIGRMEKSPATLRQHHTTLSRLEPIHGINVGKLSVTQAFDALKAIEAVGHRQTAHRAMQMIGRTLRWAIANGYRTEPNFIEDIHGLLKPQKSVRRAALTDPAAVGEVLRALSSYRGPAPVCGLLRFLPHVFVRPGEARGAKWAEFDLDKALWVIPAARTKMRRPHAVPLSRQVLEILRELAGANDDFSEYVFPGERARIMSDATLARAHRSCVPTDRQMIHGWRSTASTILNERGFDAALIELQLAHSKRDRIAGIYDRSQRLAERAAMMQAWSDMLDEMEER